MRSRVVRGEPAPHSQKMKSSEASAPDLEAVRSGLRLRTAIFGSVLMNGNEPVSPENPSSTYTFKRDGRGEG